MAKNSTESKFKLTLSNFIQHALVQLIAEYTSLMLPNDTKASTEICESEYVRQSWKQIASCTLDKYNSRVVNYDHTFFMRFAFHVYTLGIAKTRYELVDMLWHR